MKVFTCNCSSRLTGSISVSFPRHSATTFLVPSSLLSQWENNNPLEGLIKNNKLLKNIIKNNNPLKEFIKNNDFKIIIFNKFF